MKAKLLVDGPGIWALAVPLEAGKVVKIGRTVENDIALNDRAVSSSHAEIFDRDGTWNLKDLGSSNGTFLNKKPVKAAVLRDGDVIRFGRCDVVFFSPDHPALPNASSEANRLDFAKDVTALKELIHDAKRLGTAELPSFIGRPDETAVPIPDKEVGLQSSLPSMGSVAAEATPAPVEPGDELSADDVMWVAEQLTNILGDVMSNKGEDEAKLLQLVMERLLKAIEGDNGFLMIADPHTNRWVVRAWVGNAQDWSNYEKEHPVPLTVANHAYQTKTILSNALKSSRQRLESSASMMLLNVNHYIAVPLLVGGRRRGVLYFDTRAALKKFQPRDVKLLERIGGYILQIEKT